MRQKFEFLGLSVCVGVRTAIFGLEMSKCILIFFMKTLYYIKDGKMLFVMLSVVIELVGEQNFFKLPAGKQLPQGDVICRQSLTFCT